MLLKSIIVFLLFIVFYFSNILFCQGEEFNFKNCKYSDVELINIRTNDTNIRPIHTWCINFIDDIYFNIILFDCKDETYNIKLRRSDWIIYQNNYPFEPYYIILEK